MKFFARQGDEASEVDIIVVLMRHPNFKREFQ